MNGTITTLVPHAQTSEEVFKSTGKRATGGFGFVRDDDGRDRFFHARDVQTPTAFEDLKEGIRVEFEPTSGNRSRNGGGNGLRAERVQIIA